MPQHSGKSSHRKEIAEHISTCQWHLAVEFFFFWRYMFFINLFSFRTIESSSSVEFYKSSTELSAIVELSYYSNAVLSPFLLESVISCAIIYRCEVSLDNTPGHVTCSATNEEILETAVEICRLLGHEFTFVSVRL